MATLTDLNLLGQQRLDVPHVRLIEAGVRGDFDAVAGKMMAGKNGLVLRGFKLTNINTGSPASQIELLVADGLLINFNATESGSILAIPADRANEVLSGSNSNVSGSFTVNTTNYIGIDYIRQADDTTTDTVQFLNASSLQESPRDVPLRRTLNYKIVISTTDFTSQPNLIPIAKVTTDSANNIVTIEDVRPMMFRLATGGDVANIQGSYSWPGGRLENTSGDVFSNGDKEILSQKSWMDSVMTRLWEIGGGEYWYSATADRNVQLVWDSGVAFSNGENFDWDLGTNTLQWAGLKITFDNSTGYYNEITDGSDTLLDGECLYVDLDRTQNLSGLSALTAQVGDINTIGPGSPPGSRWVIARRIGDDIFTLGWKYPVGSWINYATDTANGIVTLNRADTASPTTPEVIGVAGGTITGPASATALIVNGGAAQLSGAFTGGSNANGITVNGGAQTGTGNGFIGATITGSNSYGNGTTGGTGLVVTGGAGSGSMLNSANGAIGIQGTGGVNHNNANPGLGGYFIGGTPTSNALAAGDGLQAQGSNIAFNASFVAGIGLIGYGGDTSSTHASNPDAGYGVVGYGGDNTGTGDGGEGVWGYGGDCVSNTAGIQGGHGLRGLGGDNTAAGVFSGADSGAGHGVRGVGGELISGQTGTNGLTGGGSGGVFTGGAVNDGVGAPGVIGEGGTSGGGTGGFGGYFTAGTGQTKAVAIPNTQFFGYTSGKTFYKKIMSKRFDAQDGTYGSNPSYGPYWANSHGTNTMILSAPIELPAGATVASVKVWASSSNGATNDWSVSVYRRDMAAALVTTYSFGTGQATTSQSLFVTDSSTPFSVGDGTASGQDFFVVQVTAQAATIATQLFYGIEFAYTITQIAPEV